MVARRPILAVEYRRSHRFAARKQLPSADHARSAGTPDVPFCAVATMMTAVILGRQSAPEWSGQRHPQHRLPNATLHARQSGHSPDACSCCSARSEGLR
jgi:hypothetical protein